MNDGYVLYETGFLENGFDTGHTSTKQRWIDFIPEIVSVYNETYHSGIKRVPKEVFMGMAIPVNKHTVHDDIVNKIVRHLVKKTIFEKKSGQVWTRKLYRVLEQVRGKYRIIGIKDDEPLKKLYPRPQLQIIDTPLSGAPTPTIPTGSLEQKTQSEPIDDE